MKLRWTMTVLCAALACAMMLAPASGDVRMVGDKCVLVDGKPFFPIGLYSAGDPKDFPMIAEAGFNLVHTYAWEGKRSNDTGQAWLDAAQEHGLMALVGLYRPDVKGMDLTSSETRIEKFKDHPALLAWHTMDEPSWDKEGDMGKDYMPAAYNLVKTLDPDHPVTAVLCHFGDPALFNDSLDVVQADYYPVPPIPASWYSGTGFNGVRLFVQKSREASEGQKPFWYVGQIFDFSVSKETSNEVPDEWKRLPTGDELRCMSYTAVAGGARGILYWSLSRLIRDEWNRTLLGRVKLWEELTATVAELNQLMPVLTADTPEILHSKDGVAAMIKSDGTDTYIIACNHERRDAQTVIEIPGMPDGPAEIVFGEGTGEIADGQLAASFAPLERRVYRLEGLAAPE